MLFIVLKEAGFGEERSLLNPVFCIICIPYFCLKPIVCYRLLLLGEHNQNKSEVLREFGTNTRALDFWESSDEDIYEDYLAHNARAPQKTGTKSSQL